jgi:hypothetical protein
MNSARKNWNNHRSSYKGDVEELAFRGAGRKRVCFYFLDP